MDICAFIGIENEVPKKPKEKMFTCTHGKTLSFQTARAALGLKFERQGAVTEVEEMEEEE